MRTALKQERVYMYAQPQSIASKTGLIGHLRGYFTGNGSSFWSDWTPNVWESKNDAAFKVIFDATVNNLFKEGALKSLENMKKYCRAHADAAFDGNYTTEYGFREDVGQYAFLFRMIPVKGDNTLYIHCYVREWLDSHMENAAKGIRFISSRYENKFILPDGGTVVVTYADGKTEKKHCRYLYDYHLEFGNNVYHICELAELLERAGAEVSPKEVQ